MIPTAVVAAKCGGPGPTKTSDPNVRVHTRRNDTHMRMLIAVLLMTAVSFWGTATRAADYPADNSGKNVRDRQESAQTPGDQSNSKADLAITQAIRKAVVADNALSTKAHNVKIITADGVVTLRGPVNSSEEKDKIAAKAKSVAGVKSVENKLEIASR
jgi:hyperosmotically inducible periplasmic protein